MVKSTGVALDTDLNHGPGDLVFCVCKREVIVYTLGVKNGTNGVCQVPGDWLLEELPLLSCYHCHDEDT